MARQFDVVIERDEEGMYVASVPQLPGCHTDARSLDDLMVEIREAIELCLETEGQEYPDPLPLIADAPNFRRARIAEHMEAIAPLRADGGLCRRWYKIECYRNAIRSHIRLTTFYCFSIFKRR
jgi:predicted RNase H-like HicB family nuclease